MLYLMEPDLYAALDTTKKELDTDLSILKKRYRAAARKAHPDQGGSDEKMQAVTLAYDILSDPEKRQVYDDTGCASQAGNYRADVVKAFTDLFLEHVRRVGDGDDIILALRETVRRNEQKAREEIVKLNQQTRSYERARARLKFKGKPTERNVLDEALALNIEDVAQQKLQIERNILFLQAINTESENYECTTEMIVTGIRTRKVPSSFYFGGVDWAHGSADAT